MSPMSNPTEIISHWIDAQPEGVLIRSLDLEHLVNRNQASRDLARLARRGRLMRVARGMYVAVTASRFGPVPPPVDKVVQSLARITGHAIVRHGVAAANALGLTMQVPVRQIYLTDGRGADAQFRQASHRNPPCSKVDAGAG
jgi:predicted transcriptional regulator of viral defense system